MFGLILNWTIIISESALILRKLAILYYVDSLPGIYTFTGIAISRTMQLSVLHKEFIDVFMYLVEAESNTITIL